MPEEPLLAVLGACRIALSVSELRFCAPPEGGAALALRSPRPSSFPVDNPLLLATGFDPSERGSACVRPGTPDVFGLLRKRLGPPPLGLCVSAEGRRVGAPEEPCTVAPRPTYDWSSTAKWLLAPSDTIQDNYLFNYHYALLRAMI